MFFIDRPPPCPFPELPEFDDLAVSAAASGLVPVDVVPAAMDPMAVTDDGARLVVPSGTAVPTL
jgi:hypothetical protein